MSIISFTKKYHMLRLILLVHKLIKTGSNTNEVQDNSIAQLWTTYCFLFTKCSLILFDTEFRN